MADKNKAGDIPNSEQELARPSSLRLASSSRRSRDPSSQRPGSLNSHRLSFPGSHTSRIIQQEKTSKRVSWGGVSREDVRTGVGEDKSEVPYPAFNLSGRYGDDAADIGIEGVEKEMGWDPKTGKWAVRPISRVSAQDVIGARDITSGEFRQSMASGWVNVDD